MNKSFSKSIFSIFTRDVFLFILNLITSIIIARKLGPELLGIWALISLIPSYAEAFGRIKFDLAAVYFIGKKKYKEKEILYHLNGVVLITSIIIVCLIFIFKENIIQLLFNGDFNNLIYIYVIIIIIPLNFFCLNYTYILISREDVKSYNYLVIIKALIGSGGASLLLLLFDFGLWSILISSVLSNVIALIYARWKVMKLCSKLKYVFKLNKDLITDFFNYSFKLYIGGIINFLNTNLMKTFLSTYVNPSKLAFFSMAQDRSTLLNKIPSAVNTLLYPRVSNSNQSDSIDTTVKAFKIILILITFSSIGLTIFIKPLVLIMYGESFLPMVIPFLFIIPGILFNGSSSVFESYFTGSGRADLVMKLSIIPLILQLSLGLFFISNFGIIGAAISFSISMICLSFLQTFYFLKITKLSIENLIPKSRDFFYIYNFFKSKLINLISN